jgi:hypothetical protein
MNEKRNNGTHQNILSILKDILSYKRKQEVHQEIWSIWGDILQDAKECYSLSHYLHKPDSPEELDYINSSLQFRFIRSKSWEMTIIELAKLFISSNDHHFNLNHFINRLKSGKDFDDCNISDGKITSWKKQLNANQALIDKLCIQRNKFYAHTDRNRGEHPFPEISFPEVNVLIQLAESIVREIYSTVLAGEAEIENVAFENGKFPHIKILVDDKKRRLEEMKKAFQKRKV